MRAKPELRTSSPRRAADPLRRLHARGQLAVGDARDNDALLAAGLQFRELDDAAAVSVLQSADPGRVIVDGGRAAATDRLSDTRCKLTAAEAVVGKRHLAILRGVVVEELNIADLRHLVVEVRDRNAADAVCLDRLRSGLHALCVHWRIGTDTQQRAIRSWNAA